MTYQRRHNIATLVSKRIPANIEHDTDASLTISVSTQQGPLHVTNVYSPPKDKLQEIKELLKPNDSRAGYEHLLAGDFNAPHTAWGYHRNTTKGSRLLRLLHEAEYTVHNDFSEYTRLGNSVERDTNPDLTVSTRQLNIQWSHTQEYFGSDHAVIQVIIHATAKRLKWKKQHITDWYKYRLDRQGCDPPTIDAWTEEIKQAKNKHTKAYSQTEDQPAADKHISHCWEARTALVKRWKKNKTNRKLRKRINQLNKHIQTYSAQLRHEQWMETCEQLQGTLSTGKTWRILRALINPDATKTMTQHKLQALMKEHENDPDKLIESIKDTYIPAPRQPQYAEYTGAPNKDIDEKFDMTELKRALSHCKGNKAPGPDAITSVHLRNLAEEDLSALLREINSMWLGQQPLAKQWKIGNMIFIPKPGKPIRLANLRPITLTSNAGKIMERMALYRLQDHLEKKGALPYNMVGYRANVSTQDALLQIYEDITKEPSNSQLKAILAIDLKKAFDNVDHDSMLEELAKTDCGARLYNYVRDFLRDRVLTVGIGEHTSEEFPHPQRGIPQGSVLSPTLFNLAMLKVHRALESVPDIRHTLYADDVTVWVNTGSPGHIQDLLQQALDATEAAAVRIGLNCSVEKTELLAVHSHRWKPPELRLLLNGHTVVPGKHIKVLGLPLQSDGGGHMAVNNIIRQGEQILHMFRRISNKNRGLLEDDLLRLRDALITSKIRYQIPYVNLNRTQENKLNTLLRKATKIALGVPLCASTKLLLDTGTINTLQEVLAVHRHNQLDRLRKSPQGQDILRAAGYNPLRTPTGELAILPPELSNLIQTAPIPRNMDKERNPARRLIRAKFYAKKATRDAHQIHVYTDAAVQGYSYGIAFTSSSGQEGTNQGNGYSVEEAEATAIAWAAACTATQHTLTNIYTDCKKVCTLLTQGFIPKPALEELKHLKGTIRVHWVPGHTGLAGNERANLLAREALLRAPANCGQTQKPVTPPKLQLKGPLTPIFVPDIIVPFASFTCHDVMRKV